MGKKEIITLVIAFLVLACAGGYGAYYVMTRPVQNADTQTASQAQEETPADKVQQSLMNNDVNAARSVAQAEYDKSKSVENARLMMKVEISSGDYQKALDIMKAVDTSKLDYDDYQNIGVIYEKLNNMTEAAAAYRKAADMWPDVLTREAETKYLRNHADLIEGKSDDGDDS